MPVIVKPQWLLESLEEPVLKADSQRPPSRQARPLGLGGAQAPAIVTSLAGDSGTDELWATFSYTFFGFQRLRDGR